LTDSLLSFPIERIDAAPPSLPRPSGAALFPSPPCPLLRRVPGTAARVDRGGSVLGRHRRRGLRRLPPWTPSQA
ncbi:Os11g0559533, partial [Oryza sativa Japonica Group]